MKRLMVDSRRILGDPARQIIIRILTIATNKHAIDPSTVGGEACPVEMVILKK